MLLANEDKTLTKLGNLASGSISQTLVDSGSEIISIAPTISGRVYSLPAPTPKVGVDSSTTLVSKQFLNESTFAFTVAGTEIPALKSVIFNYIASSWVVVSSTVSAATLQQLNASGNITAWNSVVEIGATPLTANVTLTLPACASNIGKEIKLKRLDSTNFTVTLAPFAGDSVEVTTPGVLNSQFGALTLVCVSTTKSEQIGNIGTTPVLAEFGEVTIAAQTITSTVMADFPTATTFTLPSAGTWEVLITVAHQAASNAVINTQVANVTGGNTIVPNSQMTGGDVAGNFANESSLVLRLTISGSNTYKLQALRSISDVAIFASTQSGSRISYKKISGFSPVSGTTVDTISVNLTGSNLSIPVVNTDVIFNTIAFGSIPYNTSTGVFTLTSGKTYELECTLKSRASAAGYVQYEWVDATTGVAISGGINGLDMHAPSALVEGSSSRAYLLYTPATNQTVRVRVTGIVGIAIFLDAQRCNANIKQLGSSATTTTTAASVICRNKTAQSIPTSAWTALTNWTEVKDTTNSFNPLTGIFTAPRAMTVQVSAGNSVTTTAAGQYYGVSIYKSGIQLYNTLLTSGSGGNQYPNTGGAIELSVGDTLQIRSFNAGTTANDVPSASNSWFTILEIPPTF